MNEVLQNQNDNVALVNKVVELSDDLLDNKDDMKRVEDFFNNQVTLFDNAGVVMRQTDAEKDYYSDNKEVEDALAQIKAIITYSDNYNYSRIPLLNGLIATIKNTRTILLNEKKKELLDLIEQCFDEVKTKSNEDISKLSKLLDTAEVRFESRKQEVTIATDLIVLDSKKNTIFNDKDYYINLMDNELKPVDSDEEDDNTVIPQQQKVVKELYRNIIFQQKNITTEADVDAYVKDIKQRLLSMLQNCDELKIK